MSENQHVKAAQARGKTFHVGRDFYDRWTFRVFLWGLDIEHGGYGLVVPLWWPWAIVPFIIKRRRGQVPFDIKPL